MKKILCLILSALLIGALCLVPASASEASSSFYSSSSNIVAGSNVSDILSLPSASLPFQLGSSYFVSVVRQPSYSDLDSITLRWTGGSSLTSFSTGLFYYLDDGVLVRYNSAPTSQTTVEGVYNKTFSLSGLPSGVAGYVVVFSSSSSANIDNVSFDLDFELPSVWNGISDFISGLFGAVGSILGGALNNSLLLMFLILIPLSGIVRDILYYNFLNKRKKSNSINRYRAKRGNYGRDSYKEV